jgi:hypothetical protein
MVEPEIHSFHGEYIRLTETFKANWAADQLLRGIHHAFLHEPLPYQIDFNAIYERIRDLARRIAGGEPIDRLTEEVDRIDTEVALASRRLRLCDEKVPPSLVRRFFEKIRTRDERIVLQVLRFYLGQPTVDPDLADKVDFLATLSAIAPNQPSGTPRGHEELARIFEAATAECPWRRPDEAEANVLVAAFRDLGSEALRARSFSELVSEKYLQNLRILKQGLGPARAEPRVLAALAICNVHTRAAFQRLYEDERRILRESIGRIETIEKDLVESGTAAFPEEFARFREAQKEFARLDQESYVQAKDVLSLKSSLSQLLSKFDLEDLASGEIEEAVELSGEESEGPADATVLAEAVRAILAAMDMKDGESREAIRLGLDPAEFQAARSSVRSGGHADEVQRALLQGAALRRAAEEEARLARASEEERIPAASRARMRQLLGLAANADRQLAELTASDDRAIVHALVRARFRLLRAYADLWIIDDDAGT